MKPSSKKGWSWGICTQRYRILVYFGSEIFSRKCPKIPFTKKIFVVNKPCGQEKSVAWQYFHKINFLDKAEKHEICGKFFTAK